MYLLLNGLNHEFTEPLTAGMRGRVADAYPKAYLKDTAGSSQPISYEAWLNSPLAASGSNINLEFVKAVLKPCRQKGAPSIEECFENRKEGEVEAIWDFFMKLAMPKTDSSTPSENPTPASSPENPNPSS